MEKKGSSLGPRECRIADDALANAIKERGKELNKLAGRLKMDGLIKVYVVWPSSHRVSLK